MDFDAIVIGAGVVGLAIARDLALSGKEVLVLERHARIGEETSSRNSEVIHAGIYYPKNSLKARLCVEGKTRLYEYCRSHGVEHKNLGKLIVATEVNQLSALEGILQKAQANGVNDLTFVEKDELQELEPHLSALRALRSPSTGIISSHELMLAFLGDIEANGGVLSLNSPVERVKKVDKGFCIEVGGNEAAEVSASILVNSAGLSAQSLSHKLDGLSASTVPPRYLSRGCYFSLSGRSPFQHLIYPIPNNEGLGVHLTLDLQGCARFGPDTEWVDSIDYSVDPRRCEGFYAEIRRYYPALADGALQASYAGIRPKVTGPNELAGDFLIQGPAEHGLSGYVALYGIESPGLTSSMAIGSYVSKLLI